MRVISFREKVPEHLLQRKQDWLAISSLSGFALWFPKGNRNTNIVNNTHILVLVGQACIQLLYYILLQETSRILHLTLERITF